MKTTFALFISIFICSASFAADAAQGRPGQAIVPEILAKGFHVHASPLSPFMLLRSDSPKLKLFQGLDAQGLGGPTFMAFRDEHKTKVAPASAKVDSSTWSECWMLFWFNSAKGWDALKGASQPIDVPVLVVLQHLPTQVAPAGTGVELTFPAEAGYIVVVPLFGSGLFPAADSAKWQGTLPEEIFQRCRLLAEISREFPVAVEETFKINPGQDKVLIRDRFEFFSIDDDFATPHRKIAPLEPAIALAQKYGFRLFSTTRKVFDPDLPRSASPFAGVEGEEYSYTLTGLMRYVNQIEPGALSDEIPSAPVARNGFFPFEFWGDSPLGGPGFAEHFSQTVNSVRRSYKAGDDAGCKGGCYNAARLLTGLWAAGVGLPKWAQEKKWSEMPKLTLGKPSPEQIRFMKDRMPDLGKPLPDVPTKTVLIWKDGPWKPTPDWMFRRGVTCGMTTTESGDIWAAPSGVTLPNGNAVPLGGISGK